MTGSLFTKHREIISKKRPRRNDSAPTKRHSASTNGAQSFRKRNADNRLRQRPHLTKAHFYFGAVARPVRQEQPNKQKFKSIQTPSLSQASGRFLFPCITKDDLLWTLCKAFLTKLNF